ncbi:MAG: helix-turn-helix domain-containing protein [Bacteroidetes bacterium]|nr:MAG: helix-turn-helix domain-containing protein [Bacteroidota bacterium]
MKHVSILVPQGQVVLSSVVGSYKVFHQVNHFLQMHGKQPLFQIDLVGIDHETNLYGGCFQIKPNKLIGDISKTDLIIVTTITGDFESEIEKNRAFIPWIKEQRITQNSEIASLCTGAFLLAETGLLNGKSCATHWIAQEAFRQRYPQVHLLPEKIISEDSGIYSSGGAYSFLNLLLHLVEKYAGREAAIWCSKLFEIEFDRTNQNEFLVFMGQKEHQDEQIMKAQQYIESNFSEKLNVDDIAEQVAISRRNFVRRFKKATSNTPLEYIQRVKVEAAKKRLENSTDHIHEVMYRVGYQDTKAFRNTFKKYTGLSPLDYRNRYNREMAML